MQPFPDCVKLVIEIQFLCLFYPHSNILALRGEAATVCPSIASAGVLVAAAGGQFGSHVRETSILPVLLGHCRALCSPTELMTPLAIPVKVHTNTLHTCRLNI